MAVIGIGVVSTAAWGCSDAQSTAQALIQRGDLAGAEAIYRELVATGPTDVEALSGLAVTLMLEQEYDQALPFQESVVALDPADALTRIELGFNYLNHQDRPSDAVRVLLEAMAIEPSAKNLTFLAQAQGAAGDAAGAESTLREALEADPEYGHAYAQLARLLEEEGRSEEAEEIRQQALDRGTTVDEPE